MPPLSFKVPLKKVQSSINNTETPKDTFWAYLLTQKKLILAVSGISAICFILLKYCFPLPDFFVDSTSYINWALHKVPIAHRPVGYSRFLSTIHAVLSNPVFTVFIQYLLFFLSTLFCFLSTDYLFGLPRKLKSLLLIAIIINPLLALQANLISSDSLFCSLTVTWFTLCLWIIKNPKWLILILQAFVLYLCFMVRYSAMFYPLIAVAVFILSVAKWRYKLVGIVLSAAVIYFAIERQENITEEKTGTRVFSGFSGWQIANNALYCYKQISLDSNDLSTKELQIVNRCVKQYFDTTKTNPGIAATYIWDARSPLKEYQHTVYTDRHLNYFNSWIFASKPLNDYGWYIVRNFPKEFIRCYILPNTAKFFYPDLEALENYDMSNMPLTPQSIQWFNFEEGQLYCRFPDLQKNIISVYPAISLLLHVFNIVVILLFLFRALPVWRKIPRDAWRLFLFWSFFYFSFMAFTIFATAVNLRFMDPVFILGLIFPFVLLNALRTIADKQLAN